MKESLGTREGGRPDVVVPPTSVRSIFLESFSSFIEVLFSYLIKVFDWQGWLQIIIVDIILVNGLLLSTPWLFLVCM